MKATSFIEISESAVENNLSFIRNLIGDNVVFSSVVKGNAYGHGIDVYCNLAYQYGVRHFSVAEAAEALEVMDSVPEKDITVMIMGMIDNRDLEWAIEHNIEFYVFESDRLNEAVQAAKKVGKPASIHVEVETGMNRTGFDSRQLRDVLRTIQANSSLIHLKGICTHLAGAESIANYKRIVQQQKRFKRSKEVFSSFDSSQPLYHMASSAATVRYPKMRLDLVRVGILQFGFFPTEEIWVHYLTKRKSYENPLKRILTWKSQVMDTKTVKPGNFVGYGTSYFTNNSTRIAHIPVGYSSGFNRSLSNTGKVLIRGKRHDVIGTVNMNMMAVDISDDKEIEKGDEVILIGNQGELEITVSSFSDFSQTVNYELLTRLPRNIPRIITD